MCCDGSKSIKRFFWKQWFGGIEEVDAGDVDSGGDASFTHYLQYLPKDVYERVKRCSMCEGCVCERVGVFVCVRGMKV